VNVLNQEAKDHESQPGPGGIRRIVYSKESLKGKGGVTAINPIPAWAGSVDRITECSKPKVALLNVVSDAEAVADPIPTCEHRPHTPPYLRFLQPVKANTETELAKDGIKTIEGIYAKRSNNEGRGHVENTEALSIEVAKFGDVAEVASIDKEIQRTFGSVSADKPAGENTANLVELEPEQGRKLKPNRLSFLYITRNKRL
jgi:hypothetical protein